MSANNILRQKLIECEALKFGDFTLTSGKKSSYYVNMKLASTNPDILKLISIEFAKLIPNGTDFIAGMELGAVPLAVALSLETGLPYTMIRKGERRWITRGAFFRGFPYAVFPLLLLSGYPSSIMANWMRSEERRVKSEERTYFSVLRSAAPVLGSSLVYTPTSTKKGGAR